MFRIYFESLNVSQWKQSKILTFRITKRAGPKHVKHNQNDVKLLRFCRKTRAKSTSVRNERDLLVSDSPNYSVISDPERSQIRMRDATRRDVMLTKQAHVTHVWSDSELRNVRNRCEWRQRGSESTKLIKMASTVHVKRFYMHGGETASISSSLPTKKQLSEISTSHQLQSICLHEEQSISRVHYCDVIQQMTRQINSLGAQLIHPIIKTCKS